MTRVCTVIGESPTPRETPVTRVNTGHLMSKQSQLSKLIACTVPCDNKHGAPDDGTGYNDRSEPCDKREAHDNRESYDR